MWLDKNTREEVTETTPLHVNYDTGKIKSNEAPRLKNKKEAVPYKWNSEEIY